MNPNSGQINICSSDNNFMSEHEANRIDLSIVIVSYNTRDITRQCLESITRSDISVSYEIIVVDNGSEDGSIEMISSLYRKAVLIRNPNNFLFAKANNQGIAVAKGKYIMLLNSDTILQRGMAEKLIRFLTNHPKASAVGPKVINPDGTLQSKGYPLFSIVSNTMLLLGVGKNIIPGKIEQTLFPKICWDENHTSRVGWIAGCCMMIKKEALVEIGGLCEELIFYGEELEWCHRANKAGWEVWYLPEAFIIHLGGRSTSAEIMDMLRDRNVQLRNYKVLMKKAVGPGRGTLISFITIILKYLRYLIALGIKKEKRFCGDLLRQVKWETVVFRYLFSNGSMKKKA